MILCACLDICNFCSVCVLWQAGRLFHLITHYMLDFTFQKHMANNTLGVSERQEKHRENNVFIYTVAVWKKMRMVLLET